MRHKSLCKVSGDLHPSDIVRVSILYWKKKCSAVWVEQRWINSTIWRHSASMLAYWYAPWLERNFTCESWCRLGKTSNSKSVSLKIQNQLHPHANGWERMLIKLRYVKSADSFFDPWLRVVCRSSVSVICLRYSNAHNNWFRTIILMLLHIVLTLCGELWALILNF